MKMKTPFGCHNRRAFYADLCKSKGDFSTPVRSHDIATASDDRDRTATATATTSSEWNRIEKHTVDDEVIWVIQGIKKRPSEQISEGRFVEMSFLSNV